MNRGKNPSPAFIGASQMEYFKPSKSETGGADSNDWKYKNQADFKRYPITLLTEGLCEPRYCVI